MTHITIGIIFVSTDSIVVFLWCPRTFSRHRFAWFILGMTKMGIGVGTYTSL